MEYRRIVLPRGGYVDSMRPCSCSAERNRGRSDLSRQPTDKARNPPSLAIVLLPLAVDAAGGIGTDAHRVVQPVMEDAVVLPFCQSQAERHDSLLHEIRQDLKVQPNKIGSGNLGRRRDRISASAGTDYTDGLNTKRENDRRLLVNVSCSEMRVRPSCAQCRRYFSQTALPRPVAVWLQTLIDRPPKPTVNFANLETIHHLQRIFQPIASSSKAASALYQQGDPLPKAYHLGFFHPEDYIDQAGGDGSSIVSEQAAEVRY